MGSNKCPLGRQVNGAVGFSAAGGACSTSDAYLNVEPSLTDSALGSPLAAGPP